MVDNEQAKRMSTHRDTIAVRPGEELDGQRLERFLREKLGIADRSPLVIRQFGNGASNLTYELRIGGWEAVLRRPPHGPVAPKAHDMGREYMILSKLHPVFTLAPRPYVYCDDPAILGSPFFVMERRHGVVLNTEFPEEWEPTPELCRRISETMVDRLVELHGIDYEEAGLGAIGYPEGFLTRQVNGWIARYERAKTDEIPGVEKLQKWMADHVPPSPQAAVIHYDYKLNNVMFDAEDPSRMVGIFDWEMTTIGDPLADLGCALCYWIEAGDPDLLKYGMGKPSVTVLPGFMTREELIEAYARKSGRDVSRLPYYLTFAYFKLAVICQQIYYRWKKGQTQDERFERYGEFTRTLLAAAQEMARPF
jgi:aminoglycoside phosphotransferase (APT) family kinase protein